MQLKTSKKHFQANRVGFFVLILLSLFSVVLLVLYTIFGIKLPNWLLLISPLQFFRILLAIGLADQNVLASIMFTVPFLVPIVGMKFFHKKIVYRICVYLPYGISFFTSLLIGINGRLQHYFISFLIDFAVLVYSVWLDVRFRHPE